MCKQEGRDEEEEQEQIASKGRTWLRSGTGTILKHGNGGAAAGGGGGGCGVANYYNFQLT